VGKIFTFIILLFAVVAGLMFSPFSRGIEVGAVTKKLASMSREIGLFKTESESENLAGVFVDEQVSDTDIDSLIKSAPTLNVGPEDQQRVEISPFSKELLSKQLSGNKSAKSIAKNYDTDSQVQELKKQIAIRDQELAETAADNRQLGNKIKSLNNQLRSRAQPLSSSKSDDPEATIRMLKESETDLLRKVIEYRQEVRSLSRKLDNMEDMPAATNNGAEVNRLKKEVISLKGKLKLKEEEVSALSAGKPYRPSPAQTDDRSSAVKKPQDQSASRAAVASKPAPQVAAPLSKSSVRDMRVKVTVPKANLRTGPGKKHGVVTQIAKGVVLSAESRSGSWFRVLDPTGKRAFISDDVVRLLKPQGRPSLVTQASKTATNKPAIKARRASRAPAPDGFVPFGAKDKGTGFATAKPAPADAEKRAFDQLKSRLAR